MALDLAILALGRDCAATLPQALDAVVRLADQGVRTHLFVGENGSRDGTRALLDEADPLLVTVVDTAEIQGEPERLRRIARGRNMVAAAARAASRPRAVLVVDLDEPFLASVPSSTIAELVDRVGADPDHFAVAATSHPYYDLLAFEDDRRSYVGLERRIRAVRRNPWAYWKLFRDQIYPAQQSLTVRGPIEAVSAFNGFCLYDAAPYLATSYTQPDDEPVACEHVVLNRELVAATGKRILIDPSIVVPAPVEHTPKSMAAFFWGRGLKATKAVTRHLTGRRN